jgi:hypothetical protein
LHGGAQLARISRSRRGSPQRSGARDPPPPLEEIIDAFTHPLLDRSARGSDERDLYWAYHFLSGARSVPRAKRPARRNKAKR